MGILNFLVKARNLSKRLERPKTFNEVTRIKNKIKKKKKKKKKNYYNNA